MDAQTVRRLVLPASLVVGTILGCRDPSHQQYCGDIETMADCEVAAHCGWNEQFDDCVNTCFTHTDQAECEAIEFCEWTPGYGGGSGGDTGGTDTGGSSDCHEPFT